MSTDLTIDADLEFTLDLPGSRTVRGSLGGSGKNLQLRISDPFLFAGRSDASAVRGIADGLARQGVSLAILAPAGPLVTLGVPRTSWLQRRVTGSRHIRVERGAGLWSLVRGRLQAPAGRSPAAGRLAPPATLFPLAPNVPQAPAPPGHYDPCPPRRGEPTAHHGSRGTAVGRATGGRCSRCEADVTTIGSDAACDIRLAGLDPIEAEVRHDSADEFVVVRLGRRGNTRVHGAPVDTALLRDASRLNVGEWTMSFHREEYADHGRPYGGRLGGEFGSPNAGNPPGTSTPNRTSDFDWGCPGRGGVRHLTNGSGSAHSFSNTSRP